MRDFRDAKAMANALKLALEAEGITVAHTRALEIVARQFDSPNWNVLSAKIEADTQSPAIAFEQHGPRESGDFCFGGWIFLPTLLREMAVLFVGLSAVIRLPSPSPLMMR